MTGAVSALQPAPRPASGAGDAARASGPSFWQVLSALNPLQYLPVIGSVYRAATGDTIPEGLRLAGSLVVGGLIGGPVSVVTGAAAIVAEKATGFDPETIARNVLADIGLGGAGAPPPQLAARQPGGIAPPAPETVAASPIEPPSVQTGATGADALNAAELARVRRIRNAYEAVAQSGSSGTVLGTASA